MGIFRRKPAPPEAAKGVEFHPSVVQTLQVLGSGWYYGDYGTMYRRQPAVRAVVDFLARNIAQLNAKVYERISNTDRVEVDDHPLAMLLRYPNAQTTRYAHMRDTVTDIAVFDRAYWLKVRSGRQIGVARISPSKLYREQVGNSTIYRLSDGREISRNNLVIFRGYTLEDDEDGISPLETLRRVLAEETAAQQNRENMWRNSARQSGFIERPLEAPPWSDVARQRFRADVESTLAGGDNAGRIGVLEEGMRWNAASFSPEQMEYVAGRKLTYEEVAIAYTGRSSIVGFGAETKANAEEYHTQLYQDVLGPWLRYLQDEIMLQLLPEFEPLGTTSTYLEFNFAEKLKGSFDEQAKSLTTLVGVPIMSPNEGRARLNLPRIPGDVFDAPIQPMNVIYGGQPAVTVPTADPSTPPTAALPAGVARSKAKAPDTAVRRRDRAVRRHEELFRDYFARQERTILSGKALKVDADRWDRELAADLYLQATVTARTSGVIAAHQLDGVYNEQQTLAFLAENARISAEGINAQTFAELAETDDPKHVFDIAKGSRSELLALGRATLLVNFARTEAAKQSQAADGRERSKTWVVTSPRSRHPEMNGETVTVSANFSNGLAWPGDGHGGSAGQVAGCHCLLRLS